MPALPPNMSIPAARVGVEAGPAGRTPNPAEHGADFAQVLSAQLTQSGVAAAAVGTLAADQPAASQAAPEQASEQLPQPRDGGAAVAPDAAAVILALAGAQPQAPAQVVTEPGVALPIEAARATPSGKQAVQLAVLDRARAATPPTGEEPAGQLEPELQAVALEAEAAVAGTRQALPDVQAAVNSETRPDAQAQPQAAGAASAPQELPRDARATPASSPTVDVHARLGTDAFADDFGNRVVWMAGHGQQAAEFRIDPPHLGPVEVRLALSNDQANLVLLSPHASVREALQSTLPRLQELLGAAGINLGSVHVGAHGAGQGGHNGDPSNPRAERLRLGAIESPGALAPTGGWLVRGTSVVDIYA